MFELWSNIPSGNDHDLCPRCRCTKDVFPFDPGQPGLVEHNYWGTLRHFLWTLDPLSIYQEENDTGQRISNT